MAKDSKAKQKNLKVIIAVMLLITVLTDVCSWKHDIPALKSAAKLYDAS